MEIAVRYLPAWSTLHVGGDWYDAFQQPDGATLPVMGDVVGHNLDAAAAMGQVRSILRGIAHDRNEESARVLTRVDAALTGDAVADVGTDGLVEQGRTGIDEGTDRLVGAVRELGAVQLDRLCDALIERIVGQRPEDDVAIVAVRCSAQDGVDHDD
jgi:serine phosphatase RsbU (regulator of sigma subunit)